MHVLMKISDERAGSSGLLVYALTYFSHKIGWQSAVIPF